MIDPTDEMVTAYVEAWRDRLFREPQDEDRPAVRAGLAAVLAIVERDLRASIARQIEYSLHDLGDEGWSHLADSAEEAGYERRTVLRRRQPETFTTLTIEAAYQHGYRRAARIARGKP